MIVLDTHAWIWMIDDPSRLGAEGTRRIGDARAAGEAVHISCISTWEVYMLAARKRLVLSVAPEVWVGRCERLSFLRFQAVNNSIARLAVNDCAAMHGDPADRLIVATALYLGATVLTVDERIRAGGLVPCVW